MGYADINFYKSTYYGNSIPDINLDKVLEKASQDVDIITRNKIKKLGGFERLSDYEKKQVQLAVCHQADYIHTKSSMEGLSSYSIGDVSVSFDFSKAYDKRCLFCLNSTRLMYRGL